MSRKDFEIMARSLRVTRPEPEHNDHLEPTGAWAQWVWTRRAIVRELEAAFPRFNKDRFIEATEK